MSPATRPRCEGDVRTSSWPPAGTRSAPPAGSRSGSSGSTIAGRSTPSSERGEALADVEGQLLQRRVLGKMAESIQGLLEVADRLEVGRPRGCLQRRVPQILHGLVPRFGADGVVSQPMDLFLQALGVEA